MVWGGEEAGGDRRPATPRQRQRVADGDAPATGAGWSARPAGQTGAAAEEGRAGLGTEDLGRGGQRGSWGAASYSLRVRSDRWLPEAPRVEKTPRQPPKLFPKVDTSALTHCAKPWGEDHRAVSQYTEPPNTLGLFRE